MPSLLLAKRSRAAFAQLLVACRSFPGSGAAEAALQALASLNLCHPGARVVVEHSRRQTLLSKSLSYFGVDATYAASIAILQRILEREMAFQRSRG